MTKEIHFSGSRSQLRTLLFDFVRAMSGRTGNYAPYVRGIKLRVGMEALACIQEAFVEKAAGGSAEAGIKWPPLKKETIAARRVGKGDYPHIRSHGVSPTARYERGYLTPAQNARWKKIFASRLFMLMGKHGMGEEEAKQRAAQIAWATLKSEGAKTKLEVLGSRNVQMGRDTGRLFNSMSPGTTDPQSHPLTEPVPPPIGADEKDRILREDPGAVIVGTNVEYAGRFHSVRNLWPLDGELPATWARRVESAGASGVLEAIGMILEGHA